MWSKLHEMYLLLSQMFIIWDYSSNPLWFYLRWEIQARIMSKHNVFWNSLQEMFSKFAYIFTCVSVVGKVLLKVSTTNFGSVNLKWPAKIKYWIYLLLNKIWIYKISTFLFNKYGSFAIKITIYLKKIKFEKSLNFCSLT